MVNFDVNFYEKHDTSNHLHEFLIKHNKDSKSVDVSKLVSIISLSEQKMNNKRFNISSESYKEWLDIYHAYVSGKNFKDITGLAYMVIPNKQFSISYLDFDLKFINTSENLTLNYNDIKKHSYNIALPMIKMYLKNLHSLCRNNNHELKAYVYVRNTSKEINENYMHSGVHAYVSGLTVSKKAKYEAYKNTIDAINKDFQANIDVEWPDNDYKKLIQKYIIDEHSSVEKIFDKIALSNPTMIPYSNKSCGLNMYESYKIVSVNNNNEITIDTFEPENYNLENIMGLNAIHFEPKDEKLYISDDELLVHDKNGILYDDDHINAINQVNNICQTDLNASILYEKINLLPEAIANDHEQRIKVFYSIYNVLKNIEKTYYFADYFWSKATEENQYKGYQKTVEKINGITFNCNNTYQSTYSIDKILNDAGIPEQTIINMLSRFTLQRMLNNDFNNLSHNAVATIISNFAKIKKLYRVEYNDMNKYILYKLNNGEDIHRPLWIWNRINNIDIEFDQYLEIIYNGINELIQNEIIPQIDAFTEKLNNDKEDKLSKNIIKQYRTLKNKLQTNASKLRTIGQKNGYIKELLGCIYKFDTSFAYKRDNYPNIIGCQNGILIFKTTDDITDKDILFDFKNDVKFISTYHEYYITMACGISYNTEYFSKNNLIRKWLIEKLQEIFNSSIEESCDKSLLRWRITIGSSAFNLDYCGKTALQCYGGGYDGKSTIEKLYRGVFDNNNRGDTEGYFGNLNSRFWVGEENSNHESNIIHLDRKRVVWSTDVPSNAREIKTGNLKKIIDTTHQEMRAAHAPKPIRVSIHPCMQLDSNVVMHLENSDYGSVRRILPYKMPVRYIPSKKHFAWNEDLHKAGKMQVADPNVATRFLKDRDVHECFLCLQIEYGYNDLIKKYNGDVYNIPPPDNVSKTLEEFIKRTDALSGWLDNTLVKDAENTTTSIEDLCKAFINYIKNYNTPLLNKYTSINDVFEGLKNTKYAQYITNFELINNSMIIGYILKEI